MIDPAILDALALSVPQWAAGIMIAKGVAAVLVNNLDTQKWGKVGVVLDWLASANKKAKLTGDDKVDSVIKLAAEAIPSKTVVGKLLRILS